MLKWCSPTLESREILAFTAFFRLPESVTFRKYIVVKKTETDIVTIEVVSLATLLNGFRTQIQSYSRHTQRFFRGGWYNIWKPNIVDIFGALFTLSLNKLILTSQYEEGARDVNNIWVSEITLFYWTEGESLGRYWNKSANIVKMKMCRMRYDSGCRTGGEEKS